MSGKGDHVARPATALSVAVTPRDEPGRFEIGQGAANLPDAQLGIPGDGGLTRPALPLVPSPISQVHQHGLAAGRPGDLLTRPRSRFVAHFASHWYTGSVRCATIDLGRRRSGRLPRVIRLNPW